MIPPAVTRQNPILSESRVTRIWTRAQTKPAGLLTAVWAGCTLAMFLFRPGYMFPLFGGYIDTWLYSALQWDFRAQVELFGPTYFAARLSALLPGMFFQHFLPADCANLAGKILVSAGLAWSMGTVAWNLGELRAALLAVLLSVVAPQIIMFLESDYVDTYVVLYGSLTLACIVRTGRSPRYWAWMILSGASFAAMGVANISAHVMPGLGLATFSVVYLRWFGWSAGRKAVSLLAFFAGAAALYGILGLINSWLVGRFDFWQPQIGAMLALGSAKNRWAPANWQWLAEATWLIAPAAALLWGSWKSWIAVPADKPRRRGLRALSLGLLVSLGATAAYALRTDFTMFSLPYYASFHLCLALPLLALSCSGSLSDAAPSWRWLAAVGLVLPGAMLAYVSPGTTVYFVARLLGIPGSASRMHGFLALMLLAGALIRVFSGQRWPARIRSILGPELLLLGVLVASVPIHVFAPYHGLRDNYVAAHDAFRVINAEFAPRTYLLWEDPRHPNSLGVTATKYWGTSLFTSLPFPKFEKPDPARLAGQTVIIPGVYGQGRATLEEANRALAAHKLEAYAGRIIPIPGEGGAGFDLVCFSVRRVLYDPENPPIWAVQPVLLFNLNSYSTPSYLEHMVYSVRSPGGDPVIDRTPNRPVFFHTDVHDHAATHFIASPNPVPGRDRQLAIVTLFPGDGHVQCTVQDQSFHHLAHLVLTKAGRMVHRVSLPADASGLRLVFESSHLPWTPLPTHIVVYELFDP